MIAILIHFLGGLLIDSAIPPYVVSVDAYFLAVWYAAFAAVDLIALSMASGATKIILRVSFAWSCALVVEQLFLLDYIQRYDWVAQYMIDGGLFCIFVYNLLQVKRQFESRDF